MIQLDQSQYLSGSAAGSGQFAAIRYRGMGFTPSLNFLSAIAFSRVKGTQGLKIYIDTGDANSIPSHAVGSELYSFVVANAQIFGGFQKFTLPAELAVTPGSQYVFYWAPWDPVANAYADDYQDASWRNADVYSGGKPVVWDAAGANTFVVSDAGNLDLKFETWGRNQQDNGFRINQMRPAIFAPGIAR